MTVYVLICNVYTQVFIPCINPHWEARTIGSILYLNQQETSQLAKRFFHFFLGPGWVFSPEKNSPTGQTFTLVGPKSYTAYGPQIRVNPPWKEHGSGQGGPWENEFGFQVLCWPSSLEKRVVPASKSFITLILILFAIVPQRLILGMRRCLAFD